MPKAVDYVSLKPGDFLSDADFHVWDADLCGAYCRIIFTLYTNSGTIKADPDYLRRVANWRGDGWEDAWRTLAPKFSKCAHGLRHKRVSKELAKARQRMKVRSAAGLAGANARWQTHSKGNADAMPRKGKVRDVKGKTPLPPLPECLDTPEFNKAWADWQAHRIEIKHALTSTSAGKQLSSCEKMGVTRAIAMIENTIEKGWTGLREPDNDGKPPIRDIAPGGFRDEEPTPLEV